MGILDKLFNPFGIGAKGPVKQPDPPVFYAPAAELPYQLDGLANQFPQWKDDAFDILNRRAYEMIRRTDVTAQPMRKLANRIATRTLHVVGEGERRDQLQEILDHACGTPAMLNWLAWAQVEGVRFVALKGKVVGDWIVPDFRRGGRYKYKAGGVLEWDGQRIVEQQRTSGIVKGDSTTAKEWPRHRFIVHAPDATSNYEGDGDLAWMLYLLAENAQNNDKNQRLYSDRFGSPMKIMRTAADGLRPDLVSARISANSSKIDEARHGSTVGMTSRDIAEILEPSGATSDYLGGFHAQLEARAHKLILQNVLTSETAGAGPTGSSGVHKSEEDMAVEVMALGLAETLSTDLLAFIEVYNGARLAPKIGQYYIALQAEETEQEITPADARAFAEMVGEVDTEWLYGIHGAPAPEGVGKSVRVQSPSGGMFGVPAVVPSDIVAPLDDAGSTAPEEPQAAAVSLNGAQITALQGIIASVAAGELPGDSAITLIQSGFPTIPIAAVEQMVRDAEAMANEKAQEPPPPQTPAIATAACPIHGVKRAEAQEVTELDEITETAIRVLTPAITKAYWAIADAVANKQSPRLPTAASDAIMKARALSDLVGRARLLNSISPTIRTKLGLSPLEAADKKNKKSRIAVQLEADLELAPPQAIQSMAKRLAIPARTAAQVAKVYREGNFAAMKIVEETMVENVKSKLAQSVAEGIPRKEFTSWLRKESGNAVPESYANTVYRNNMNESYSAGRLQQMREVEEEFAGWRYETAGDNAVRPEHAALDGKVFPMSATDLMPPNGHNCRCTWHPVEKSEKIGALADPSTAREALKTVDPDWVRTPGGEIYKK